MPAYYLDIETTGLDPAKETIITIQYQELSRYTGKPKGPLHILKSWESGEQAILDKFGRTGINNTNQFDFIPVGYNLQFEHKFLYHKAGISVTGHPYIDLHHITLLMNSGEFRNSGLDKMTGKQQSGTMIPTWYKNKQYDNITQYIEQETGAFCEFYVWLLERLPKVHKEFIDHIK